jgi:hypothetical protein
MRQSSQTLSRRVFALVAVLSAAALLQACATQSLANAVDPPGFLHGLLHGFLILFSFIGSLFTDYRIYAVPNSGAWYDLGFVLGAMSFLGGGGAGACVTKR